MPVKGSLSTTSATIAPDVGGAKVMSKPIVGESAVSLGPDESAIPSHNPATGTFYV
jgi:hypothetical protein